MGNVFEYRISNLMNKDQRLLAEAYEKILKEDSFDVAPEEHFHTPMEPEIGSDNPAVEKLRKYLEKINPNVHHYKLIKKLVDEKKYKEALEIAERNNLHQVAGIINNLMPELHGVKSHLD